MILKARVEDGKLAFEEPLDLPNGTEVTVEFETEKVPGPTVGEFLLKYAGVAKGLPSDLARNHDHYLYGVDKK
ncbi:MAG: hypothetical protein H6752_16120 [Candidatus Omnitrophica bacterium]|nr:hypothetical protein [Candidatus Omnitrophota bacterium]